MTRRSLLVLLVALALLVPANLTPAGAYAGAPWFEPSKPYTQNFPDPNVIVSGGKYYAYATVTGGAYLPAMSSTDLQTWIARPAYDPGAPLNRGLRLPPRSVHEERDGTRSWPAATAASVPVAHRPSSPPTVG